MLCPCCVPLLCLCPLLCLTTRKLPTGLLTLVNLPGRRKHTSECPFNYDSEVTASKPTLSYPSITNKDGRGRIVVDPSLVETLYEDICINSKLNILTSEPSKQDFEASIIDGARLLPLLAKNKASQKIRFGINSFRDIKEELSKSEDGDFRIQFNVIAGFDEYSIFTIGKNRKRFTIEAGKVISRVSTSTGPFMATTVYSNKNGHVFPVMTNIISVYKYSIPIPAKSNQQRELVEYLSKEVQRCSISIFSRPILSDISQVEIEPKLLIESGQIKIVIADPLKDKKEFYQENGILIWHRSLNTYKPIYNKEISLLASKIKDVIT